MKRTLHVLLGYMPSLGNKRESAVGTNRARTAKRFEKKITTTVSDKELGTARQQKRQESETLAPKEKNAHWIRLAACTSISSILNEFNSSLIL